MTSRKPSTARHHLHVRFDPRTDVRAPGVDRGVLRGLLSAVLIYVVIVGVTVLVLRWVPFF